MLLPLPYSLHGTERRFFTVSPHNIKKSRDKRAATSPSDSSPGRFMSLDSVLPASFVLFCVWVFMPGCGLAGQPPNKGKSSWECLGELRFNYSDFSSILQTQKVLSCLSHTKASRIWARFCPLRANSRVVVWKMSFSGFQIHFFFFG